MGQSTSIRWEPLEFYHDVAFCVCFKMLEGRKEAGAVKDLLIRPNTLPWIYFPLSLSIDGETISDTHCVESPVFCVGGREVGSKPLAGP